MVDILEIINELPQNPSEALIELNWRLSKMAHLFPKAHKKSDIVYNVPLLLDNKKSYLKPAFDSHAYIDYLKSLNCGTHSGLTRNGSILPVKTS